MKQIIIFLLLLSSAAHAQEVKPKGLPSRLGSNVWVNGFLRVDSALLIAANDTITKYTLPAIVYRGADSCLYFWNMVKFQKMGAGAGGSTDTVSLSLRIDGKLNKEDTLSLSNRINTLLADKLAKADTTAMLLVYLRKGDTTAMLAPYMKTGDSAVVYITPYQADTLRTGLLNAIANVPIDTSRVKFSTVEGMQAYAGAARFAFVEDPFDGGSFYLIDEGPADDSLVYEGATGFWKRELDFDILDTSPTGDLAFDDSVVIQHGDKFGHYSVKNLLFANLLYPDPDWLTLSISKIAHLLDSLGKKQDTLSGTGVPTFAGRVVTFKDYIPSDHVVADITGTDISHWNDAYDWGDHAGLYPTLDAFLDSLAAVRGDIGTGGGGGVAKYADLLDVDTSGLLDGYVARWVAAHSKWEPIPVVTVDLSGISVNDYPGWDGAKFVKKTPDWLTASTGVPSSLTITINGVTYDLTANRSWTVSGGEGGATYFSDLLDIRWTNLKSWDLPVYSEDSAKWLNRPMIRADLSGIINNDLVRYRASDSTFIPYTLPDFLLENQTITFTGDATGAGKTTVNLTIGTHKILNDMLAGNIDTGKINGLHNELAARQALNTYLTQIAGLSPTNGDILRYGSGGWDNITTAAFKTALGLTKDDVGLSNVVNVNTTNANNITAGTLNTSRLATSGVTAGNYTFANLTIDAYGRVTAASNGVLSTLTFGSGLTGSSYNGSSAVTLGLDNSVVALLSGTQTFTGNKTFTGSILVPTRDPSDSSNSAAPTKWVKQLLAAYSPGGPSSYTFIGPLSETSGTVSILNAAANGSTKGAAAFNANDFNDNGSGLISFDYTNAQSATGSQNGILKASDWADFNSKQSALAGTGFVRVASGVVYYENKTFMETSHVANGITSTNINNWNNAYSWGNHASVGYSTASNTQTFTNKTWHGAVISPSYGGLGASNLTGYIYANGSGAATASPTIPYSSISGFNTSNITEGSKLFYTNARGLATTLTGFTSGAGSVLSTDNILQALQKLYGNQQLKASQSALEDTAAAIRSSMSSGSGTTLETGVYTPTATGAINASSVVFSPCMWTQIGDFVTVYGSVTFDLEGTTGGEFQFDLPVSTSFDESNQLIGNGSGQNDGMTKVFLTGFNVFSNLKGKLQFDNTKPSSSTVSVTTNFSFRYQLYYP